MVKSSRIDDPRNARALKYCSLLNCFLEYLDQVGECMPIIDRRRIYLENAGWLLELRDRAMKEKKWLEVYLLTFFRIELGLIMLIDLKMPPTGKVEYSDEFLGKIVSGRLRFAELIDLFCSMYGDKLFHALDTVRKERNDFVHNFFKKVKVNFIEYVKDLCIDVLLVENELGEVISEEVGKSKGG